MDAVAGGREIVELLERGDAPGVADRLAARHEGWPVDRWLDDVWRPTLGEVAGEARTIVDGWPVGYGAARFAVDGRRGRGFATVRLDPDGRLGGITVQHEDRDGIANVIVSCPWSRHEELDEFYASLIGRSRRRPRLVFDEADERFVPPPPTQVHLDLAVPGVREHRIVSDPLGHPVCLRPGPEPAILSVVFDGDDPSALAAFWSALLDMPVRIEEGADRVVIGRADGVLPTLGFQRVVPYVPPAWPDPDRPAQGHLDLMFDDRPAAEARIVELGGTALPPHGGSCPVYADPAGHPFCVGFPGE